MNLSYIYERLKEPETKAKIDARFGLGRLEKFWFSNWFNPFATLYLNFRSFPLKQAIKMPVYVYGHPRLYCLSGKMRVIGKVKPGMIRLNFVKYGAPGNMSSQSEIYNLGEIVFHGMCEIGTGNKIITGYGRRLSFGDRSVIMDRCTVAVHDSIELKDNTRIANNCQILDTNYHFMADLNTRTIKPRTAPVIIGSGCWVCQSTAVSAGAVIPDNCIVASHSMVNKDFSSYKHGGIIGGIPAKMLREGIVRVFNSSIENEIWKYYHKHGKVDFPLGDLTIDELTAYK